MKTVGGMRSAVLALGLALGLVVGAGTASAETAPDFTLTTLDGKTITKASLQGKPTLLMFWASWCGTCQRELPNLKTLYEEKKGKGFQAVAVGFQDDEAGIRRYVETNPGTFVFPTAYDTRNQVSALFRARGTPTFVLLDADGAVALIHTGGEILRNPAFQQFIQAL